jgi:hypothetical protein
MGKYRPYHSDSDGCLSKKGEELYDDEEYEREPEISEK